MKNLYKAFASAAVALLAVSCVNEMANDTPDGLFRKYNLSFDDGTKTGLSGSGSTRQVKWNEGDEIKYYTKDKQSSVSTASVSLAGSTAFVEIPRGRSDDFINAVYGAGSLTGSSSTADCMYVTSPAKNNQSYTSFAQAHLCAAFSADLEDPDLKFHNAVSILKFTSATSISKVVFSGNNGEVITGGSNGSLKISYSGGAISAEPSSTGGTSVTVTTGGQEADFYIAILPVNFSEGIIVRGYDASGYLLCERKTSGALNTVNAAGLPVIANLGSIQNWLDNPKPTAVDLGLSVKWASFNLGAKTPEGSGDYFSWGETASKSSYSWSSYTYGQGKNGPFSEYVADAAHGTPDYKTILDLEDDAAHAIWGDAWRMPSKEEFQELRNNCTWTWTTLGGVNGYKITSKKSGYTGNFIFLPAAGMMSGSKVQNAGTEGDYWSSSLYTTESCSSWSPYFTSSEFSTGDCYRYFGLPVRPVYGEVVPVTEITLNTTYLELLKDGTSQLTATISPANATYKGITWTSSDESVATVDANGKVKAVNLGKSSITATTADGAKAVSCEVTVYQLAQSITLDHTELEMYVGDDPVILTATVLPDEHTLKNLIWSSDEPSVATVDSDGKVTAVSFGTAKIKVKATDGSNISASCVVTVKINLPDSVEAIDLGLSVKWATMNVGATKPEEYGEYFAWGEKAPKSAYSWSTYKFGANERGPFSKYYYDNRYFLDPEDDAAQVNWGNTWRMPKNAEWEELIENCTWTRTSNYNETGIAGIIVTSNKAGYTDQSIFLPAAGKRLDSDLHYAGTDGYYWSSTLIWGNNYSTARHFFFYGVRYCDRYQGNSVRPVFCGEVPVSNVSLSSSTLFLKIAESQRLTADIQPASATDKRMMWASSDNSVVTVDQNGKVTAVGFGKAFITVTTMDGAKTATCEVTVYQPAQSITLNLTEVEMFVGDDPITLVATILPENTSDKSVIWTSSDKSVATVDEEGKVMAVSNGTTTITGSTNDSSGLKANCTVTVRTHVSTIKLDKSEATINVGSTLTLSATITPSNASDKSVIWSSADAAIATVNESGTVTGVGLGTTTVTATTVDGGYTASCEVNVLQFAESITLSHTELETFVGDDPIALVATVLPENTSDKSVIWTSSNKSVATVDEEGKVTAVSNGTATITVSAKDGSGVKANCSITVCPHVLSVTLNKSEATISVGKTLLLKATIIPSNAYDKSVIWSSADAAIATVNESGTVTGVSLGTTTVTATTVDGGYAASCSILIQPIPEGAVDLGLSVLWASRNVGATKPERYGDYFAWGETKPKSDYSWETYKWCNVSSSTLTKYNDNSSYGTVDNKTVLDLDDDAARANWGGSWRMPTDAEWMELINNCTWTWTNNYNGTGVAGSIVTSKKEGYTDRSIFLPAAGRRNGTNLQKAGSLGRYWSSSLDTDYPHNARDLYFNTGRSRSTLSRTNGQSIRPVSE